MTQDSSSSLLKTTEVKGHKKRSDPDVTIACDGEKKLEAHKNKMSLEEQVKTLQKHMGALFKTVKDLKSNVESLDKKLEAKETAEIKEIIEAQRIVDEVIVANSDAIKRLDREIRNMTDANTDDTK